MNMIFMESTARIGPYVTLFIVKVVDDIVDIIFDVTVDGMFDRAGEDGLDMSFILLVAMLVDEGPTLFFVLCYCYCSAQHVERCKPPQGCVQ